MMAKGSKPKTPSAAPGEGKGRRGRGRGRGGGDDDDDRPIDDARFAAAATRPQFSSRGPADRRRGRDDDDDDDDDGGEGRGGKKKEKKKSSSFDPGLGESLARAIESDERFRSALASDPEGFGCVVPARDKYGRETAVGGKRKKGRRKRKERAGDDHDGEEEEGDDDNDVDDDDDYDDGNNGSMEARIAYLNALSRGDISASSSSSSDGEDDDDDNDSEDDDGDGDDGSSSSSSSSSSADEVYGKSGIFDPNRAPLPGDADVDDGASLTDEPSRYLCVLNLNWDRIRAVDVYAMLHSFCPPGTLRNVAVYPSDFGLERMEKERIEGPTGIWKGKREGQRDDGEREGVDVDDDNKRDDYTSNDGSSDDEDDPDDHEHPSGDEYSDEDEDDEDVDGEDAFNLAEATSGLYAHFPPQSAVTKNSRLRDECEEEEGFDVERLREYEASRLRYYFAIATFTSSHAASRAYEGVDGLEVEDSAAEVDVRVLPENALPATVRDRPPRDVCDALPARYEPPEGAAANALRQSRVTCTWERGDVERERKLTRHYGMVKDAWEALATGDDIGFYLATSDNSSGGSSGSDEDDDGEAERGEIGKKSRVEGEEGEKAKGKKNQGMTASTKNEKKRKRKGSIMRAMLGLEGSDSEEEDDGGKEAFEQSEDQNGIDGCDSSSSDDEDEIGGEKNDAGKDSGKRVKLSSTKSELESEEEEEDDDDSSENMGVVSKHQATFIPGKRDLEGRIRSKLMQSKHVSNRDGLGGGDDNGLSPYEKYLEKRKEKRKERRQAVRNARRKKDQNYDDRDHHFDEEHDGVNGHDNYDDNDGMYGVDPEFGVAPFSDEESHEDAVGGAIGGNRDGSDEFFIDKTFKVDNKTKKKIQQRTKLDMNGTSDGGAIGSGGDKVASTKEELELLIAGDDGLTKLERHSSKKLKGKRKRQLETLAANVSGQGFHIDTSDTRFAALLDGNDDRFGIDRTNPAFKETGAMKELLNEQSMRRNKNLGGRDKEGGNRQNGFRSDKAKDAHGLDVAKNLFVPFALKNSSRSAMLS
ncbi:hypothetical protein ACHAW5_004083 [Stephanodiscus triporus]|uniref:ESF1 RRM domain-containing protein n=1 Tax=Stephanodiscus triporus TaxID=2934178 RepID=A0ABD3PW82_9STRA